MHQLQRQRYRLFIAVLLLCAVGSLYAGFGIGASISAGSRFAVGGRLKFASEHTNFPQPMFSLTGTPLAKKRYHLIRDSEYLQLREKNLFVDFGILEQLGGLRSIGLEAEISYRIITGWYRGSERLYEVQYTPVLAIGPVFPTSDYTRNILRFMWYQLNGEHCFAGTFIFDVGLK